MKSEYSNALIQSKSLICSSITPSDLLNAGSTTQVDGSDVMILTADQRSEVLRESNETAQINKAIDILSKKPDKVFQWLIELLRNSGHDPVVDEIEDKARRLHIQAGQQGKGNADVIEVDTPPQLDYKILRDLIYWRHPKKSGVVFGGTLLLLIAVRCWSIISVMAYGGLLVLAITLNYRVYKSVMATVQKTEEANPFKYLWSCLEKDMSLSKEKVHKQVDILIQHVSEWVQHLSKLFLVENIVDSLKFGIMLWALTYIGACFSGTELLIFGLIAVFSLPKLYEMYTQPIDNYYNLAHDQFTKIFDQVKEKVPMLKPKQQ